MSKREENQCDHIEVYTEVIGGQRSGDYICTKCGKTFFSRKDHDEYLELRKKEKIISTI